MTETWFRAALAGIGLAVILAGVYGILISFGHLISAGSNAGAIIGWLIVLIICGGIASGGIFGLVLAIVID